MGELTIRSYMVLQSEEVFDLFAEAIRKNRPLELDLLGEGEACRVCFRADTVIHDPHDWRILGRLENGSSMNIARGRLPDGSPYADHALIVRRPDSRPEQLTDGQC